MMHYIVAVVIAFLIIGAGCLFVLNTRSSLQQPVVALKAELQQKKALGQLPPEWQGIDIDQLELSSLSIRLSEIEHTRLDIADLLVGYWYAFGLIAFAVCLRVTYPIGRTNSNNCLADQRDKSAPTLHCHHTS